MSEYFSNFPRILYDINGTNQTSPDFSVAVNLMVRQKLREAIKNEITIYYPYVIPEEIKREWTKEKEFKWIPKYDHDYVER